MVFENSTTANSKSRRIFLYDENEKCVKACSYLWKENNVLLEYNLKYAMGIYIF